DLGIDLDLSRVPGGVEDSRAALYAESGGRFLVTVSPADREAFEAAASEAGVPYGEVGRVTGGTISITGTDGGELVDLPVDRCKQAWKRTFESFREGS
ncbi:MAG: AIR synthase-related protein, partial [Candidatus Nanohaloarchaea archaeon]